MGKTTLARMLPGAVFMNCDLPSVARRLEDPELFFRAHPRFQIEGKQKVIPWVSPYRYPESVHFIHR